MVDQDAVGIDSVAAVDIAVGIETAAVRDIAVAVDTEGGRKIQLVVCRNLEIVALTKTPLKKS